MSADGQVLAQDAAGAHDRADQALIKTRRHATVIAKPIGLPVRARGSTSPSTREESRRPTRARRQKIAPAEPGVAASAGLAEKSRCAAAATSARQLQPEVAARIMRHHLPGISTVPELQRWYPPTGSAPRSCSASPASTATPARARRRARAPAEPGAGGPPGQAGDRHRPERHGRSTRVNVRKPQYGRNVTLTTQRRACRRRCRPCSPRPSSTRRRVGDRDRAWTRAPARCSPWPPRPGYDNNQVHTWRKNSPLWRNQALQTIYEPGSTFKVVTFSAALPTGVIWPGEVFHNVPDHLSVRQQGDPRRHPAQAVGHHRAPHPQDLVQRRHRRDRPDGRQARPDAAGSAGTGSARRRRCASPARPAASCCPAATGRRSSIGTIPIGQGIGVTAMQMASMYQAIANGGVMVQPHLVAAHSGPSGRPAARHRRVLSPQVDRELVSMLEGVVDAAAPASQATIPGYTVAGKTGTAQKPNGHGGYSEPVRRVVRRLPAGRASPGRDHGRGRLARRRATSAAPWRRRPSSRSARGTPTTRASSPTSPVQLTYDPASMKLATLIEAVRPRAGARAGGRRHHRRHLPGRGRRARARCTCACPGSQRRPRLRRAGGRATAPRRCRRAARSTCRVPQLVVESSRRAMAAAADAFYGHPSGELDVVGVTGTNGKTTTAFLMHAVLDGRAAGGRACSARSSQRVGGRRRAGRAHDARERRPAGDAAADGRRRRPRVRDGGLVARARARARGRRALRRRRVHEPDARTTSTSTPTWRTTSPPRRGCSTSAPGGDQHRRRVRPPAGRRGRRPGAHLRRAPDADADVRPHAVEIGAGGAIALIAAHAARAAAARRAPARRVQRRERALRRDARRAARAAARGRAGRHRGRAGRARPVRGGRGRPAVHRARRLRPHARRARERARARPARSPPGG